MAGDISNDVKYAPCWCGSGKKYKWCHYPHPRTVGMSEITGLREVHQIEFLDGDTADVVFEAMLMMLDPQSQSVVREIRQAKADRTRPMPSSKAIVEGSDPAPAFRLALMDEIARMVDENWAGRSDMCIAYAALLDRALAHVGISATAVVGKATYEGSEHPFTWDHAWVAIGEDVVDGNVDSMAENVMVPNGVSPVAYWGPAEAAPGRTFVPSSRKLDLEGGAGDVEMWWTDLERWLDGPGRELLTA